MKKHLLTIAVLMITLNVCNGQTGIYHPFPDSSAIWRESCSGPGPSLPPDVSCDDYQDTIAGDTIIGLYVYHKIWEIGSHYINSCGTYVYSWHQYVGAIRQDTTQKKVFYIAPSQINDTLLYDFNLSVGDTLHPSQINDTISIKNYVSSIDSVFIGNSFRKRFRISCSFCIPDYVSLIEGIGSTFGLLNGLYPPFEWQCQLLCFTQNGHSLYPDTIQNCGILPVGMLENKQINDIRIAPNPFSNSTTIQCTKPLKAAILTIYNIFGQQVKQIKNISGQTITLQREHLKSGLYFVRIEEEGRAIATEKLMIAD